MTKQQFSKKFLKCTYNHFRYVLRGERGLNFKKAEVAAKVLGTDVTVWLDPTKAAKRREAWDRYQSECKGN